MMVSIIIPTYNRADYISETLDSLINQSFNDWECIIVDDGSADNTEEIIKSYLSDKRFKFFQRPSNMHKGANSCRNFGFTKSIGKYIKFLDSDDWLTPDCLAKQVNELENDDYLKVCFSYGRFFNSDTKVLEEYWSRNFEHNNYLLGHIKNEIRWAISDPLWRKSFFITPPFKEGLMNSQEWLMHGKSLALLKKNEVVNLKETFSLIRRGNVRMSSKRFSIYYKNQKLSRYYLLQILLKLERKDLEVYYQLLKQILIFQYWQIKSCKK